MFISKALAVKIKFGFCGNFKVLILKNLKFSTSDKGIANGRTCLIKFSKFFSFVELKVIVFRNSKLKLSLKL